MRKLALATLMMMALAGCGDGNGVKSPPNNAVAAADEEPAAAAPREEMPPEAKAASHYYAMEEGGEYGYESGISADDKNAGKVAGDIVMVRYLGKVNDQHTLTMTSNGVTTTLKCKEPCEFAKARNSAGNVSSDPQTMRLTEGSMGWAMAQDAMANQLKVYRKP